MDKHTEYERLSHEEKTDVFYSVLMAFIFALIGSVITIGLVALLKPKSEFTVKEEVVYDIQGGPIWFSWEHPQSEDVHCWEIRLTVSEITDPTDPLRCMTEPNTSPHSREHRFNVARIAHGLPTGWYKIWIQAQNKDFIGGDYESVDFWWRQN